MTKKPTEDALLHDAPHVIVVVPQGPYVLEGSFELVDIARNRLELGEDAIALCRCGQSARAPLCDGLCGCGEGVEAALAREHAPSQAPPVTIRVLPGGPLIIRGEVTLDDGGARTTHERLALCRCGHTRIAPMCDGGHNCGPCPGHS